MSAIDLAKDLGHQFEDEARTTGLLERLQEHDKLLMLDIIRDAGAIAKQAVTDGVDIERERAQLEAQFLNLNAHVMEDAKRVFFNVLGKRLAQIGTGLAVGLIS